MGNTRFRNCPSQIETSAASAQDDERVDSEMSRTDFRNTGVGGPGRSCDLPAASPTLASAHSPRAIPCAASGLTPRRPLTGRTQGQKDQVRPGLSPCDTPRLSRQARHLDGIARSVLAFLICTWECVLILREDRMSAATELAAELLLPAAVHRVLVSSLAARAH